MAQLERLREKHREIVEFLYVYIKEAHPEDEWQSKANLRDDVVFKQPTSLAARMQLAKIFVEAMEVRTPTLIDDIQNTANACYAAWPERLYVIGTDGRIAYKGGMGPFDFRPEEIEEFVLKHYAP